MALKTTWGASNRVVEEELRTTYTREEATRQYSNGGQLMSWKHWNYTRTREKKYKYIGLTREAAKLCAKAMNILYMRKIKDRVPTDGAHPYWSNVNPTSTTELKLVQCGHAVPTHADGCGWEVNVTVNEEITIPFRESSQTEQASELPTPWTSFEEDPTQRTLIFMGWNPSTQQQVVTDFDYDEGEVGYGSAQ